MSKDKLKYEQISWKQLNFRTGLVNQNGMTFLLRDVNRFKSRYLPNGVLSLDCKPCVQFDVIPFPQLSALMDKFTNNYL